MKRLFLASVALLAIVFGAVAGVYSAGQALAADHDVTIAGFAFSPATVTVAVGDTVTWTNNDDVPHTATSSSGVSPAFDTGNLSEGASGTVTFNTAGSFSYFCKIHPNMTGTVVVTGAAASPTASGGGGATATAPPSAPRSGSGTSDYGSSTNIAAIAGGVVLLSAAAGSVLLLRRRS